MAKSSFQQKRLLRPFTFPPIRSQLYLQHGGVLEESQPHGGEGEEESERERGAAGKRRLGRSISSSLGATLILREVAASPDRVGPLACRTVTMDTAAGTIRADEESMAREQRHDPIE